jgi:ribonuclease HI
MGVWASLFLATRLSIPDLHVLGDSKIVIDWLNRKGSLQVVSLERWKERIKDILKVFRNITFAHIYREENQEADRLSKLALTKPSGSIAYNQWECGHEGPTLFLKMY